MVTMPYPLLATLAVTPSSIQKATAPSDRPLAPDVLLARPEEAVEAERALNARALDPKLTLLLTSKRPVVACYGRLARETQDSSTKVQSALDLIQHGDATDWTPERTENVRNIMLNSPFRDMVRNYAREGRAMTLQFSRATAISVLQPNGYFAVMPLGREPVGRRTDLANVPARVTDIPPLISNPNVPTPSPRSISCIVRRGTSGTDSMPFMQAGLKALAARRQESVDRLARAFPPAALEITPDERRQAIAHFADSYKDFGFASREEALKALPGMNLVKYASLEADIDTPNSPDHGQVGWTLTNLP